SLIGQLFDTYWLFEMDNALFIMDQHAAHEKVMFERLMKEHENRAVTSQMVSPTILHPSMQEMELLKEYTDVFAEYGFELESFWP
ncbi:MAG: DNA mismatch repair protein MutL, partial [Lachnospiraceae bacterium]